MYIEKASQYFGLIRNRDLPNKRIDLEFIEVLLMCFVTVFSVGTEGLYLCLISFVKVNKYSIQCSDASLDHTDHWIILFCFSFPFFNINVSSGGFDPRPMALSSSVSSNVPC